MSYFESPEWVAGVRTSVEKATGFSSCTQQILSWKTLGLGNVANLEKKKDIRQLLLVEM